MPYSRELTLCRRERVRWTNGSKVTVIRVLRKAEMVTCMSCIAREAGDP